MNKPNHLRYVLNEQGEPQPEPDLMKWAAWMETKQQQIAHTRIGEGLRVSTALLGLDFGCGWDGPPILWETMIFAPGTALDHYQDRCAGSREQALAMHEEAVALLLEQSPGTRLEL